jgi:hypothetical protein
MRSLCQNEVSDACLAVKSPSACIDDLTAAVLARGDAAPGGGRPSPAAVVLPAIAAGVWNRVAARTACVLRGCPMHVACCMAAAQDIIMQCAITCCLSREQV